MDLFITDAYSKWDYVKKSNTITSQVTVVTFIE